MEKIKVLKNRGFLKALWQLTRLEHGFMLAIAVLIGALIANGGSPPLDKFIYASLTVICIEAGAFALNDYFDLEVDIKNNRMDRPLARNDLSPKFALYLSCALIPLGVFFSVFLNKICFMIALLNALVAVLYDLKMKETKVIGNFYIAFTMAIPFLFGGAMINPDIPKIIYFIASMAFLSGIGREITKDLMDIEGDALRNTKSLSMYIGEKNAMRVASSLYLGAVSLSFLPFFFNFGELYFHNFRYLSIVLISDLIFFHISVRMIFFDKTEDVGTHRKSSLIAASLGLAAFLVGAFF